ncbi:hypothetical protein [Arthrobacter sp. RCC_34]
MTLETLEPRWRSSSR